MSQESVEIVRRGFTATLEGDWRPRSPRWIPKSKSATSTSPTPVSTEDTRASANGCPTGVRAGRSGGLRASSFVQRPTTK